MLEVEVRRALPGFQLDVSFHLDGEVLGILGPSGSGKTMTLRCIAGLVRPDQGFIKLNGRVLFDSSRRVNLPPRLRKVGLVFQNYGLFPHLSTTQNIAYGIRDRPGDRVEEQVRLLVERMGLKGLEGRRPGQLSSGQQQRVAVARALAPEPEVLLLDEPFSALDSLAKERLQSEIMEVREFYRGGIILVTHDLAEAYRLSSRLAVCQAGKLLQSGPREKVLSCPASRTVAAMMGIRNWLEGSVVENGDTGLWVALPELETNLRVAANGHRRLAIDQPVGVGVHPRHVRVADKPGQNTLLGKLDRKVEEIAEVSCRFRLGAGEAPCLEALLPDSGARSLLNGQQYYLHLPPEHLTVVAD